MDHPATAKQASSTSPRVVTHRLLARRVSGDAEGREEGNQRFQTTSLAHISSNAQFGSTISASSRFLSLSPILMSPPR